MKMPQPKFEPQTLRPLLLERTKPCFLNFRSPMAPNRRTPTKEPEFASSSSEEEIVASGEDEEEKEEQDEEEEEDHSSDQEDEAQGMPSKLSSPPFHTQTSKKPDSTTQQPDSDSEFETDSESESESELQVKNVASKPMEKAPPPKATKPISKTLKSAVGEKRVSEVDRTPTKDSKRAKVKDSEAGGKKSEDGKKQLFQRVWSEDDEIAVLKGIIEFNETKGIDPAKDMSLFYDFIKKSLHFDVTLAQLKDKVWRLKKKFGHHVVKGNKGEDKIFAKPHDQKAFKLWKQIWGSEKSGGVGVQSSDAKPNGKGRKSLAELKEELGLNSGKEGEKTQKAEVDVGRSASELKSKGMFEKIADFGRMADYVMKKGPNFTDEPKKAEMEERWKKLHVEEVELFIKRTELVLEQTKLMFEASKAQKD